MFQANSVLHIRMHRFEACTPQQTSDASAAEREENVAQTLKMQLPKMTLQYDYELQQNVSKSSRQRQTAKRRSSTTEEVDEIERLFTDFIRKKKTLRLEDTQRMMEVSRITEWNRLQSKDDLKMAAPTELVADAMLDDKLVDL